MVIQFSEGHDWPDAQATLNDLMNHAVVHAGYEPVLVGFLIEVEYQDENPVGFQIYRVARGEHVPPRNQPTATYIHGVQNVKVVISPADLGYHGFAAWWCGNFELSMRSLWYACVSDNSE